MAKEYLLHDDLRDAGIHCAALVITENWSTTPSGTPIPAQPDSALRNGTVTFIRSAGRVYGITCQHVIDHYRKVINASGNPGSHSMRTMLNGFFTVHDYFVQPTSASGQLDIAIRELHPDFVQRLGKRCIDVDSLPEPPEGIKHGYAVGFPESLKYKKFEDGLNCRISMPQVQILAEIEKKPGGRFAMFSELEAQPEVQEFSGMSGGPIYWSTADSYGILGIAYEGGVGSFTPSVYVFGEFATPEIIRSWLRDLPTK